MPFGFSSMRTLVSKLLHEQAKILLSLHFYQGQIRYNHIAPQAGYQLQSFLF